MAVASAEGVATYELTPAGMTHCFDMGISLPPPCEHKMVPSTSDMLLPWKAEADAGRSRAPEATVAVYRI